MPGCYHTAAQKKHRADFNPVEKLSPRADREEQKDVP